MNLNWILHELVLHLFVSLIHSAPTQDPLIFNPYTLEIYDLENIASSTYDGLFALACPPEDAYNLKFNEVNSLDWKALFVRRLLKKEDPDLRRFKCKKTYRMSVVYHNVQNYGRLLEFGYEIYYCIYNKREDFKVNKDATEFGRAEDANSKMRRFLRIFTKDDALIAFQKLVWISKGMFRYNFSEWSVEWVSYSMNLRVDELQGSCANNNLGSRLRRPGKGKKSIDFYSTIRQASIFSQLNLPASVDGICKSNNKCVEEYNLVPPYRFRTPVSKSIECSNLTSVPIWYKRSRELLDYSEKFIIALDQMVEYKIEVTTGVYDTLAFPKKGKVQAKSKLIPVYLDWKKRRFPVPKIIYKVVSSTAEDCDESIFTCHNLIVIIIHNGPEILPEDKLCEDKCAEWGWGSVQYLSTTEKKEKSQFIYCCKLDENLRDKLRYVKKATLAGILDLKSFPNYTPGESDTSNYTFPNIHDDVENKMNELFGSKKRSISGSL